MLSVSTHTHTHIYTPYMQYVSTQIRGREVGVIKIAYRVNLQENTAAGNGRVAMVSEACEREAGYTLCHQSQQSRHTVHCGKAVSAVL